MSNMNLWDAVCVTDPSKTKRLGYGSKLTAIDAYSQIKAATEQFGPVGKGWGWEIMEMQYPPNDTMVIRIRMWHTDEMIGAFNFDVCGQASLYTKGKDRKADDDCAKKALTDGVTKGLSYLGFNADVFEGKFDDSKYVAELEKSRRQADDRAADAVGTYLEKDFPKNQQEWQTWATNYLVAVNACNSTGALDKVVEGAQKRVDAAEKASSKLHAHILDTIQGRRDVLETPTQTILDGG